MTAQLRRVLVRRPRAEDLSAWREYGWRGEPDAGRIEAEHEALCDVLRGAGAEVVHAETPVPGNPDAIYVFDPTLLRESGAILLRPGKPGRRGEPDALATDLDTAGISRLAEVEAPGVAEGGDMFWLDERTLLVGRGYRTNGGGIDALRSALPDVEIHVFDLPHLHGEAEVLHLLSLLSLLDKDLAVAYLPLLPVRLVELLAEHDIRLVQVPDDEFETMGANVLALGPRAALALEGNEETRRRLEQAGVDVQVYAGDELSRKGDGGPTCLTLPLLRAE